MPKKADADDYLGRFREIVSDPINLLINRHPLSGTVEDDLVCLHNGNRVSVVGHYCYYGRFSEILIINRGVHEPVEEFIFQEVIKHLGNSPKMLELGAYWGHYSMWFLGYRPHGTAWLVEPEPEYLETGRRNFKLNGYKGNFILDFVGSGRFSVDEFMHQERLRMIDILHADIQGFEVEMLNGCVELLSKNAINYIFISTHSQELHNSSLEILRNAGYRIEVASDYEMQTTSFDGLVFASSPKVKPVFHGFLPLGRAEILKSTSDELLTYLRKVVQAFETRS